jgi:hypothetical protein
MKKILTLMLAVTLLTSCDTNPFAGKARKSDTEELEEKEEKKNKKDKADRDDEEDRDDEDDNKPRKKTNVDRDDADDETGDKEKDDDTYTTKEDDNTSSGWTNSQRESYINDCVSEARKSISTSKAKSYCDCMQNKIEKKYRMSFVEASRITTEDLSTAEAKADIQECLSNY